MRFSFLILFFLFNFSQSQENYNNNSANNWETYFSYSEISDSQHENNTIFFSSDNALFSYNFLTLELDSFDTLLGLSGDKISSFFFSELYNKILIGYENGLIQILDLAELAVINILDIKNKTTIPSNNKRINNFYFHNNTFYVSTDYGISVFYLEQLEFGDTFYIGNNAGYLKVSSTIVNEQYIYASCLENGGIRMANLDQTLIDYNNWSQIYSGSFDNLIKTGNGIYFNDSRNIYKITNGSIINVKSFNNDISDFKEDSLVFTLTFEEKCLLYDQTFTNPLIIVDNNEENSFNTGLFADNRLYIGSEENGVLVYNSSASEADASIYPNGPIENNIFSVESKANQTWVTFGNYTEYFNPSPLNYSGVSRLVENNWNNVEFDSLPENSVNLNKISINPFNNNQVFISSFHGGLLEFNNNEFQLFDESNSDLESLTLANNSSYQSIRISDTGFDSSGILWILNSKVDSPLKSFDFNTGLWDSYDFTPIIPSGLDDELGFSDIEIDTYGTKWIGGLRSGLIGFNNSTGSIKLKKINNEEQVNLPSKNIKSLAIDKNNHLWIGTIQGLRVLYNTSNFFDSNPVTQQIIILEDGLPRELLEQQFITDIEVDGANNKWVGTIGSGVFYFSPNGQQTIYHFTKENSPLPSNNINDIAINDETGLVFFGTDKGLVSYSTGSSSTNESFAETFVYPNPIRPGFDMLNKKIKISGLTDNCNIKITDIEGNLVAEAQSKINRRYNNFNLEIDGGTAFWNGKNMHNNSVSSGVYLVMLSDLDSYETKILKIMIIR